MSKKKKQKKKKSTTAKAVLLQAIVDLIIGIALLIIEKLIN